MKTKKSILIYLIFLMQFFAFDVFSQQDFSGTGSFQFQDAGETPSIASNGNEDVIYATFRDTSDNVKVYVSEDSGRTFSRNVILGVGTVIGSSTTSNPKVAVSIRGGDNAYVIWLNSSNEVKVSFTDGFGRSFQDVFTVAGGGSEFRMLTDTEGALTTACWIDNNDNLKIIYTTQIGVFKVPPTTIVVPAISNLLMQAGPVQGFSSRLRLVIIAWAEETNIRVIFSTNGGETFQFSSTNPVNRLIPSNGNFDLFIYNLIIPNGFPLISIEWLEIIARSI